MTHIAIVMLMVLVAILVGPLLKQQEIKEDNQVN
jgi:hypothetical protein